MTLMAAALALVLAGCQGSGSAPAGGPAPSAGTASGDLPAGLSPCVERLNEIGGQILMFYTMQRRLPADANELKAAAGNLPLACPDSGQPYVYRPGGLKLPGQPGLLVLYDATPFHNAQRWGLFIVPPRDKQPLIAAPAAINEKAFQAALPASAPDQPR